MATQDTLGDAPLFAAVTSSTRQLYLLLRCISFTNKVQVQLLPDRLQFRIMDSSAMEASAALDKSLFTTFQYNGPDPHNSQADLPVFEISLPAILETLQILGLADSRDRPIDAYTSITATNAIAFDRRVLGMNGICRFSYVDSGSPFCITLEETGVRTVCELNTFEPAYTEDIPFSRRALVAKILVKASSLFDAMSELATTPTERLVVTASPSAPYLSFLVAGEMGETTVDFDKDSQMVEAFQAPIRTTNAYKFEHVKRAARAMSIAAKVSIRIDNQGVLSLQLMVEGENGSASFVDFVFVPLIAEEGDEHSAEDESSDDFGSDLDDDLPNGHG